MIHTADDDSAAVVIILLLVMILLQMMIRLLQMICSAHDNCVDDYDDGDSVNGDTADDDVTAADDSYCC